MQKTSIEWCEFTSNPVKGDCPVGCSFCYVKSFRRRYGWHDDIRFYPGELEEIRRRKKPARIFLGSTIELLHEQTIQYIPEIMQTIKACPQHRFYFLTKCPQNLPQFSPFPPNAWVGVSATNQAMHNEAIVCLEAIDAQVKYISYEPLLERIEANYAYDFSGLDYVLIDFVIIGAQTQPYRAPAIGWVREIVRAADEAGAKVFLKDNLKPLLGQLTIDDKWAWSKDFGRGGLQRQEMPE